MHLSQESDDHLMRRIIAARDQHAFRVLVERHQTYGMTLAVRILQDEHLAEETLQDAFLRVWRAASTFTFSAKFTTWFYRILYNACLTRLRTSKGYVPHESVEEVELATQPDAFSGETIEVFERTVSSLPEKYRVALTLFYLQEMSYEEIAEVCDLPLGTVKTLLFRGRERLKRDVLLREQLLG